MKKHSNDVITFKHEEKWYWNPLDKDIAGVGPFSSEQEAKEDAMASHWAVDGNPSHMVHVASLVE